MDELEKSLLSLELMANELHLKLMQLSVENSSDLIQLVSGIVSRIQACQNDYKNIEADILMTTAKRIIRDKEFEAFDSKASFVILTALLSLALGQLYISTYHPRFMTPFVGTVLGSGTVLMALSTLLRPQRLYWNWFKSSRQEVE